MTADDALENYYEMCRQLVKAGWTLNDIEEAEFDTLIEVVCHEKAQDKPKRVDLMDYMKNDKGIG